MNVLASMSVRPGLRVAQVLYQDPFEYPPVVNTARALGEAGAEVLCLGLRRRRENDLPLPAGVRVNLVNSRWAPTTRLGERFLTAWRFRRDVQRALKEFQPDLVIGYDHFGGWALLPGRGGRSKLVLHILDTVDPESLNRYTLTPWAWDSVRRHLSAFSWVILPDENRRQDIRRTWRLEAPSMVITNSPQRRDAARNDILKNKIAASTGVRPEPLAIVLGNMGFYVECARALSMTQAKWHLAIVGAGDEAGLRAMRDEAARLQVADRIHVFPYTAYDTIREWVRGCDVGLALHPRDAHTVNWRLMGTGSVKVQEYLAAGIPSIVCSERAFGALARDTGALEILESESATAIAKELDGLEPGTDRWHRLAAAASRSHLERFNVEFQFAPLLRALGMEGDRPRADSASELLEATRHHT